MQAEDLEVAVEGFTQHFFDLLPMCNTSCCPSMICVIYAYYPT